LIATENGYVTPLCCLRWPRPDDNEAQIRISEHKANDFGISIAKMVLSKIVVGGAGGNWRTINEILDPNVVRQSGPVNCGAACGEMLLRARGVFVTQDVIADIAGAPSSASSLAQALNELDSGGTWFGSGVTEESLCLCLVLGQSGFEPHYLRVLVQRTRHFLLSIRRVHGQQCCLKPARDSVIG
jgi:hypothetical protein